MNTTEVYDIPGIAHPLLEHYALSTELTAPLGELKSPASLVEMLSASYPRQLPDSPDVKPAIRRLLRAAGFKPSGRNKPASEYLIQAVEKERLQSINLIVDIINVVSYHSGIPISVVDQARLSGRPRLVIGEADSRYIFNASGQVIDVSGLLCLADELGPCANAVKDSQRTKTHAGTQRLLTLFWGSVELEGRTLAAVELFQTLMTTYLPQEAS